MIKIFSLLCLMFSFSAIAGLEMQQSSNKAPIIKPPSKNEIQVSECRGGPMVKGKLTIICKTVIKPQGVMKK